MRIVMESELWTTLLRFHREIAAPEIMLPLRAEIASSRDETMSHLDALYSQIHDLKTEYQSLTAAVKCIKESTATLSRSVVEQLDRVALRSELQEIDGRLKVLERRVADLRSEI
jgi:prefoldin subunit 5